MKKDKNSNEGEDEDLELLQEKERKRVTQAQYERFTPIVTTSKKGIKRRSRSVGVDSEYSMEEEYGMRKF